MKLEYVNDFIALAETGNFLQAAEQRFIAQSSLSRHIQLLEEELCVKLFARTTRSSELTDYGLIFLPYAKKMLALQDEYKTAFFNHKKDLDGRITIGCIPEPEAYGIPNIIARFAKKNSKFKVDFVEYVNLQHLYDHTVDFFFYIKTKNLYGDLIYLPFDSDHLVAVFPENHPHASQQAIHLNQLKDEKFLFYPKNSEIYNLCLHSCYETGFQPNIAYSGSHAGNIIALVKANAGTAVLPKKPLLQYNLDGVKIVDLTPKIITPICLVYLKNSKLSNVANLFVKCVEEYQTEMKGRTPSAI